MKLLTEYQQSEIVLGSIYFFFLYTLGSYLMTGELNLWNIIPTTGLFIFWIVLVRMTTNYVVFNKLST